MSGGNGGFEWWATMIFVVVVVILCCCDFCGDEGLGGSSSANGECQWW